MVDYNFHFDVGNNMTFSSLIRSILFCIQIFFSVIISKYEVENVLFWKMHPVTGKHVYDWVINLFFVIRIEPTAITMTTATVWFFLLAHCILCVLYTSPKVNSCKFYDHESRSIVALENENEMNEPTTISVNDYLNNHYQTIWTIYFRLLIDFVVCLLFAQYWFLASTIFC